MKGLTFILLSLILNDVSSQERSISGSRRSNRRVEFPQAKARVPEFHCPQDFGYYAHPVDCQHYYVCVFGGALMESCTGGLMYSNSLQTCDWPRNVQCPISNNVDTDNTRTASKLADSTNSNSRSFPSSSSLNRHLDNLISAKQPLKQSARKPSKINPNRIFTNQGTRSQALNTRFQAQETSSRSFNVVPSAATTKSRSFPSSISSHSFSATKSGSGTGAAASNKPSDYYYYYDDIIYDDYFDPVVESKPAPKRTPARNPRPSSRIRGNERSPVEAIATPVSGNSVRGRPRTTSSVSIASTSFSASSGRAPSVSPFSTSSSLRGGQTKSRVRTSPSSSSKKSSSRTSGQSKSKASQGGSPTLVGSLPSRIRLPSLTNMPKPKPKAPITDIWKYPPRRPVPTRHQPPVESIARPCDRSVCKIPDCSCGGGPIPGGLSPESVPQMVLLTFDDSINDLNKKLYAELFERGRKNPNGCPIVSTMYVSHEWTDYSQVQNLYADGHEIASHSITHSFGEKFSTLKWAREIQGQREILSAYGGVRMEDVRGMRAPFLAIGGDNMFKMLYDQNFTYDSSMPVYKNTPPSWPYTLDYKVFHDCMIPPCPKKSFPGVWEVPMVMWTDLVGGRCSMADACTTPADASGVYDMLIKNFERHYTTNRSPIGLYYHAAWFTRDHHKEGFIAFLDAITALDDVWLVTNWQALQWVRNPVPISKANSFGPFQCNYPERPGRCSSPRVCNVWHKGSVRYMKTCQRCPDKYPWTGNTGVPSPFNTVKT